MAAGYMSWDSKVGIVDLLPVCKVYSQQPITGSQRSTTDHRCSQWTSYSYYFFSQQPIIDFYCSQRPITGRHCSQCPNINHPCSHQPIIDHHCSQWPGNNLYCSHQADTGYIVLTTYHWSTFFPMTSYWPPLFSIPNHCSTSFPNTKSLITLKSWSALKTSFDIQIIVTIYTNYAKLKPSWHHLATCPFLSMHELISPEKKVELLTFIDMFNPADLHYQTNIFSVLFFFFA